MKRERSYLLLCCLLVYVQAFSQRDDFSNYRNKTISTAQSLLLDSLSIVPNTFTIAGVAADAYLLDPVEARVTWLSGDLPDSVQVSYRVFPFKLNSKVRSYDYDSIRFNFLAERPYVARRPQQQKLIDFGNINYNGSFGRGISFGNNQDAVVNSTMNLQLNGMIGDSMELTAAISDNNIPIQPQGNTQNIRDFDRIFMQVKKRNWRASFGDIDIRENGLYFLNFYKRLQGASIAATNRFGNKVTNSIQAAGAIAKGKFTRNIIAPIEGNQGPYHLKGANNELYFAVLAGTERVYLNGELLTRGQDQDYVIDYNTAELTFMVKRLITRDSRIQVEFEYSDRNFLNSMLYATDELAVSNKLKITLGAYSNTDAKNSAINQTLSNPQKQFLSGIGNDIGNAFFPNEQVDTFSINKILYRKIDTTYNGLRDTIYQYATDNSDSLYSLSFSFVGAGNGDYVAESGNANGRVFRWVQPMDTRKQGEWAPVTLLVTPKKHDVFTAAARYDFNEKISVNAQVAMSNNDVNTFSAVDDKLNKGMAAKVDVDMVNEVFQKTKKGIRLTTHIGYETVEDKFRPLETLRNVEFNRDWGLPLITAAATEHLLRSAAGLQDESGNFIKYRFESYTRSDGYTGTRHSAESNINLDGWQINNRLYYTKMNSDLQHGDFIRPSVDIHKTIKAWNGLIIGGSYIAEHNHQSDNTTDTLIPPSFGYNTWRFYLKSADKKANRWGIQYFTRENKVPVADKMTIIDRSKNVMATLELLKNEKHRFNMSATYRNLEATSTASSTGSNETLLGRAEYSVNEWKGFLTGSVLYEIGSGQEQKREYTYLEVPAGQGFFTWNDYNQDGIPQINEFEEAVFQDQKKWVRIYTPTNQYVKANYLQFHYAASLNPAAILPASATTGMAGFVRRFSTTSSLQMNKKELAGSSLVFDPFKITRDSSLITLYSFFTNTLYFNRTNVRWGADVTHRVSNNRSLLNYGFETNTRRDLMLKTRVNFNKAITGTLTSRFIKNELNTPSFANRNYLIKETIIEPALSYVYGSDFRVAINYGYENKKNTIGGEEKAASNIISAEARYNVLSSGIINGKFSFNNISFTGEPNSTAGFILLNGLMPGKNYLWTLELTKRMAGNIELNVQYEGRKPGDNATIHTGRATVRAIF